MRRRSRSAYIRSGGRLGGSAWNKMKGRAQRRRRRWPIPLISMNRAATNNSTTRGFGYRPFPTGSMTMNRLAYPVQTVRPAGGNGSTFTRYNVWTPGAHPKIKFIRKTAQEQFYQNVMSRRMSNANYGQQALDAFYVGRVSELHTMATTALNYNATTDIFIDTITVDTEITNQSKSTTYLDLYEITPRFSFESAYDPVNVISSGSTAEGVSTGAVSLGLRPTMIKKFTYMYSIHKKFTIELGQGQSHRHTATYHVQKRYNEAYYDLLGGSRQLPQVTKWLLIIASGAPLNDSTTKTNVSTSTVALDIVRKERYKFLYTQPAYTTYTFVSSLPAITTGNVMDPGSGEAETMTTA